NYSPLAVLETLIAIETATTALPNLEAFEHWLDTAKPYSMICYARGTWLEERTHGVHLLSEETLDVARAARWAYENGEVELFQKRTDRGNFDYLAMKRRRPHY